MESPSEVNLDGNSEAYLDGNFATSPSVSYQNRDCVSSPLTGDVLDCKRIIKDIEIFSIRPTNFVDIQEDDIHYADVSDLSKPTLQGANIRGVNLDATNLRGANLEEANLQMANLEGKCLKMTNLQGAVLRWARLNIDIGTRLRGADLRGSYVKSVVLLTSSTLYGANLRGMHLEADLGAAALQGADLRGVQLIGAIPGNFALQNADLKGAHLKIEVIGSCVLQGADLRGAYIMGTNLGRFTLQGADLRGTHIDPAFAATLQNVDLAGVYFIDRLQNGQQTTSSE